MSAHENHSTRLKMAAMAVAVMAAALGSVVVTAPEAAAASQCTSRGRCVIQGVTWLVKEAGKAILIDELLNLVFGGSDAPDGPTVEQKIRNAPKVDPSKLNGVDQLVRGAAELPFRDGIARVAVVKGDPFAIFARLSGSRTKTEYRDGANRVTLSNGSKSKASSITVSNGATKMIIYVVA